MSNEKKTGCLGYIGDENLPIYMGIIINHKRIPINQPVSWKVRVFFSWLISQDVQVPEGIFCSSSREVDVTCICIRLYVYIHIFCVIQKATNYYKTFKQERRTPKPLYIIVSTMAIVV